MRIHVLQPNVANRIAAGEVVERPLSIVKELVENALDAGATSISIEIENGGIDLIRVSDNGKGISFDDCPLAFLRHATSKITDSEDIRHIETLGFRGEALASIASVSEVTLKTRERDAEEGTLYRIDNGNESEHVATACTEGTVIEVKNLFSKVPARLKFLKSSRTEAGYIGDYVSRIILCYPNVSFSFVSNGKSVYRTYGNSELRDAIYRIYGADTLTEIIPLSFDDGYISISGYIGTPALAKPNRSYQTIFVNGRYIKDFKLSNAALRAYDTHMFVGKFPFFVVNLSLSPYEVDINVHPQKMEVRFADEMRVCNAMYAAVFRALNGEQGREKNTIDTNEDIPSSNVQARPNDETSKRDFSFKKDDPESFSPTSSFSLSGLPGIGTLSGNPSIKHQEHIVHEAPAHTYTAAPSNVSFLPGIDGDSEKLAYSKIDSVPVYDFRKRQQTLINPDKDVAVFPDEYKLVGTCFNGYIIVESKDKVFVIDQHAAHERVLYEKLMAGECMMDSQKLLFSETLRLNPVEMDLFNESSEHFITLGFEFETDSDSLEIKIQAVPVINGMKIPARTVYDALEIISERGDVEPVDFVRSAIIQASCKHAVKVTETLDEKEIKNLLSLYATGDIPLTCPHGRPVFITVSKRELEKRFKRIQ